MVAQNLPSFEVGMCRRPIITYLRISALRSVSLPPRASVPVPAHAADEYIRRSDGCQEGDAAFCKITLDTC